MDMDRAISSGAAVTIGAITIMIRWPSSADFFHHF